jgi:hypothetical protein
MGAGGVTETDSEADTDRPSRPGMNRRGIVIDPSLRKTSTNASASLLHRTPMMAEACRARALPRTRAWWKRSQSRDEGGAFRSDSAPERRIAAGTRSNQRCDSCGLMHE